MEVNACYIRALETKARGLEPRIRKRLEEGIEEQDILLYADVMHLLGFITALTKDHESK